MLFGDVPSLCIEQVLGFVVRVDCSLLLILERDPVMTDIIKIIDKIVNNN